MINPTGVISSIHDFHQEQKNRGRVRDVVALPLSKYFVDDGSSGASNPRLEVKRGGQLFICSDRLADIRCINARQCFSFCVNVLGLKLK